MNTVKEYEITYREAHGEITTISVQAISVRMALDIAFGTDDPEEHPIIINVNIKDLR